MKTKIIAGAGAILLIAVLLVVLRPASFTSTLQKQVDKMDVISSMQVAVMK